MKVLATLFVVLLASATMSSRAYGNHGNVEEPVMMNVWPAPTIQESYSQQSAVMQTVTPGNWRVTYGGFATDCCYDLLQAALDRFWQRLHHMVPPDDEPSVNHTNHILQPLQGLVIDITSTDNEHLHADTDESYELQSIRVSSSASVQRKYLASRRRASSDDYHQHWMQLTAPTAYGVLHGLQTFWQLLQFGWSHHDTPVFVLAHTPLHIVDAPAYPYRGILVDTARHYLPMSLIQQQLEAMEWNKLNVLHWHLTDGQAWPYASAAYPELAAEGAFCRQCVYTAADIGWVQQQAAMRGIRVVLELDLPGHSRVIGQSHPEWMTACHGSVPSEPLNATSTAVYDFVRTLYAEVAGMLDTVVNSWIHVGGDEVPLQCWEESPQIQDWIQKHGMNETTDLLAYFENELLGIVTDELNLRPIVWQELYSQVSLPEETVVDVWMLTNLEVLHAATAQGYDVLLSACWYLDHLDQDWRDMYNCDPQELLGPNATTAQQRHLLGGHASMWGERVDDTNFMSRVWPRASAVAERLWTGSAVPLAANTSRVRLNEFRCRMVQQGVPASPIDPGYCRHDVDEMSVWI